MGAESPDTGEIVTVVVTGDRLLLGLQQALYDTELIPVLPLLISVTADGNTGLLAAAAADVATGPLVAEGMRYSVLCGEEIPFLTEDVIARGVAGVRPELQAVATAYVVEMDLGVCSLWEAAVPSSQENEAVVRDLPTLVLSGQLDPITPPYYSRAVADRLPKSQYVEFAGFGHGVLSSASPSRRTHGVQRGS